MFVVTLWLLGFPYAILIGVLVAFTALIPRFWRLYRMCFRSVFHPNGKPRAGVLVHCGILGFAAVGGKSCISARCGPFGTLTLYMGLGGGYAGAARLVFGDAGVYSVVCRGMHTLIGQNTKTKAEQKDSARG